jgi:hypothetical protein
MGWGAVGEEGWKGGDGEKGCGFVGWEAVGVEGKTARSC